MASSFPGDGRQRHSPTGHPPPPAAETAISLVRDDLLFRVQRGIGLIPARGLGLLRRTAVYVLFTWLPIAVWALWRRRAFPGEVAEPLLAHYAIHAQLLLCLPVLILGEGFAHKLTMELVPLFLTTGLVPEAEAPRFRELLQGVVRLRNSMMPWLVMGILILAWFFAPQSFTSLHELDWATVGDHRGLAFAGMWYMYVARPLFLIFLLA